MKQIYLLHLSTILLIAILLISCTKEVNVLDTNISRNDTTTIRIMAPSGELYNIDRELMTAYERFSGNKIDFQEIPDDQYANVLKTRLATGQGPDIAVVWAAANASQFFPEDNFLDLSGETWVTKITTNAIRNQSFNKKIIGFGLEGASDGWGIIYNKQIFKGLNIGIPTTMEEFLSICNILQVNEVVSFAGAFKEEWTLGVILANIGALANLEIESYYDKLNRGDALFADSEVFRQAISDLKIAYDQGYIGAQAYTTTARDAFIKVIKGEAAMALSNSTPEVWMADSNLNYNIENYGMFPIPFANNNMLSFYSGGFIRVINKNSSNISASKDYFTFLSQHSNLKEYYSAPERRTTTPAFKDFQILFNKSYLNKDLIHNSNGEQFQIAETGLKYWDNTVYGQYILDSILGKMTPEDVLMKIDSDRLKMFGAE